MGSKRSRESDAITVNSRKKQKGYLKDSSVVSNTKLSNSFESLNAARDGDGDDNEEYSDSEVIYDYNDKSRTGDTELALLDSSDNEGDDDDGEGDDNDNDDGDDDGDEVHVEGDDKDVENDNNNENELTKNQDFIEFGFASSDDDEDGSNMGFDDEESYSDDEPSKEKKPSEPNCLYPWVKNHDHSQQREVADWLTLEMKDFVNYISPSSEEIVTRNLVINTLKTEISKFWPGTETHVFGSSATDLYLPGSDIDMVVISSAGDYENRSRLYQLSSFLKAKKLAKNMEVIAGAKVPIIKFVDPHSELHIDISFERTNGLDAARRIRKWLVSTPGLRELVLVVKQFLRSRKLNNVHVGGLGGYATIIMCYHFLRLHPKVSTGTMRSSDNLGVLLIEFFELYGRNFSYDNLIISLDSTTDEPRYLQKDRYSVLNTARNTFAIVIQDPADAHNNITRSSYNLRDLKKAFGGAYQLLVAKCYELHGASYKARLNQSILGDIIKFKGKERHFRDERHLVVNEALVSHEEYAVRTKTGDNNEFYFSDMTSEEEYSPTLASVNSATKSPTPAKAKTVAPTPLTNKAKDTKKLVESFLSLEKSENEDEDEPKSESQSDSDHDSKSLSRSKPKSSLDKDTKRDYWRQKGLDL
ncbi:uncharacterized protein LODBEIA_P26690 [Lodderomyces beijingensis]|uniref:polynucleotide adenylyltransferase n=1 Tax=Lodderomyces beijingensis TaxID=1775926 RepID=A0ABP0ZQG1_9ASCO